MTQSPTPHTPKSWGAASRGYAEQVAPRLMRPFVDAFLAGLPVDLDTEALEVGAGSGAFTEVLFPQVKSLFATDFSPAMIEVLRERMEALGATNIRFGVMDGQALNLDDSGFDAAACCFTLMLFPDRAKGFSELCRVLRPGGRAMVSGWAGPDRFELFGLFLSAVKSAFPDLPPPPSQPVFSLADLDEFKAQMEAGGFREVEVNSVARDIEIESIDHIWAMLTAGAPPVQILFDRVGVAGRNRLHDCLAEIVEQRFGGGPIRTTNVATVAWGCAP